MNKLLALADRVEKLTGPDREVDAEIAACLRIGTECKWAFNYPEWEGRADGRVYLEKGGPSFAACAYTGSLDAAMTLVPEGWTFQCERWREGGASARVNEWNVGDLGGNESQAATPALALLTACLRARAHGGGEG